MESSSESPDLSVCGSSIKITDVTQDGDTLIFAITSQRSSSSGGVCVFRNFEDFDWLQQNLFNQEDVPGLQGVIFPPLPARPSPSLSHTQSKGLKQLGFLALGDNWANYCKALEIYVQQVAAHAILSKNKALDSFLTHTASPGKQRVKKGIFNRLSQAVEEMRKENHKDVDDFFQKERDTNMNITALYKSVTEGLLDVVLTEQKLSVACGHFAACLHMCVNQDDDAAVAFSKICLKLSDIFDSVKRNFENTANDNIFLGLGLDLEARHQEAEKEMLFRRTCRLVELETASRNTERAKANKRAVMEELQSAAEKEFTLISSVAKKEIKCFHGSRVSVLRDVLIGWCEKQLATAKGSATHLSNHLEAFKALNKD